MNFVLTLVLARILCPEDFGLLGMATVIYGFISYFSDFGLCISLIKKTEIDDLDCNTVFWGCVIFGIVTYLSMYALAPYIAAFYGRDELIRIIRCVSVIFLVTMYSNIPFSLEIKRLQYHRTTIIQLVSLLVSGIAAIVLAMNHFGVWALVWQMILMHIIQAIGYAVVIRWIPRFQFSWHRFKSLAAFGFHVTANNLVKFASENIDYLLVGKLLGPSALGIYTMAFRLSRYPIEKLWAIFGKMMLPAFALMQNDMHRIKKNLISVSLLGMTSILPFLAVILFFTKSYILITVGEKWLITAPLIQTFILYLAIMSISFSDDAVLIVIEKIKSVNIVRSIIASGILLAGYFLINAYQEYGMALAFTVLFSIYFLLMKTILLHKLNITFKEYFSGIRQGLVYCCVITAIGSVLFWQLGDRIYLFCIMLAGAGVTTLLSAKQHFQVDITKLLARIKRQN